MSAGKSTAEAERAAQGLAMRLPVFNAVQRWLDNKAEIKLKEALANMMMKLKIPALIIRSIDRKVFP